MADFTLNDIFGGNATRPNHPDFWSLSEIVLSLDSAMDDKRPDEDADDVIAAKAAEIGDSYSICYMAVQRAFRIHGAQTVADVQRNFDAIAKTALIYMEGVIVGARFERKRDG